VYANSTHDGNRFSNKLLGKICRDASNCAILHEILLGGCLPTPSQLTSCGGLGRFVVVSAPSTSDRSGVRRLTGAILLAFLVFLPLHYHAVTATSQLAKECSCVHGTRTQLIFYADAPTFTPPLLVTIFAAQYVFSWADDGSKPQNVRGPPATLSI
jgi:hypothetical protein